MSRGLSVRSSREHRRSRPSRQRGRRRLAWPTLILAGVAGCFADEGTGTSRLAEESNALGADGAHATAVALPPGEIIDTLPASGWTEGSFSVNHNGAAEYHLPLWVPEGRGGLQPGLALQYNSQTENGLLGVGWSLSAGLSSIAPCPRTLAHDGRIESSGFGRADAAYCMDGQRLRPAAGGGTLEQDYRTEHDGFARIRAYHSVENRPPSHFTVWTKDGRILTYDRPIMAYGLTGQNPENPSFSRSSERVTIGWALRSIQDRNGNEILYLYDSIERADNEWSVEIVPRHITYGPDRHIELIYESRNDPITAFRAGQPDGPTGPVGGIHTDLSKRLAMIKVSGGGQLLREYRLDYVESTRTMRSLLNRVTECDGAEGAEREPVCLNSLDFDWADGLMSAFEVIDTDVTDAAIAAWDSRYFIPGDIDGDGRDDLLYRNADNDWKMRLSTGTGFGPAVDTGIPKVNDDYHPKARPIDFDRDGRMDVMVEVPAGGGRTQSTLFRSTEAGYEPVFTDPKPFAWDLNGTFVGGLWASLFADIDGDGLPDYVGPELEGPGQGSNFGLFWRHALNTGSQFGPIRVGVETEGPIGGPGEDVPATYQIRTAVFDGPRVRLLHWEETMERYGAVALLGEVLGRSSHGFNLPFQREPENTDRRNLHFADVNGDGLPDAVYPCTGMSVQLSSGVGYSALIDGPSEHEPCPEPADDNLRVRVLDYTGDGADDVLLLHGGVPESPLDYRHGIQLYTWNGRRMVRRPTNIPILPISSGGEPFAAIQPLDFDGDGLVDIAKIARSGPEISTSFIQIYRRRTGLPLDRLADKLTHVNVENLGARVEVEYTTLANRAVHDPASASCGQRVTCPRRGGVVVSKHRLANGMTSGSPWREFTHHYVGARADVRGRGWLGFARHDTLDAERGAVARADFANATSFSIPLEDGASAYVYPHVGQPFTSTYTLRSGEVDGSPVTYEATVIKANSARLGAVAGTWVRTPNFVVSSDREQIGESEWTVLHSRTTVFDEFDEFMNITKVTTIVPGTDQVDQLTYENDATKWLIGLPDRRTTTSCSQSPTFECQTRTSSFDYDDNGNLEERVVEPDDQVLLLRTRVAYGNFGNISSVTTSDSADESRVTSFTYDSKDLFPRTSTNALGQTTSVTVHPDLGVVLDSQDVNGVVPATMKYDRFGRLREVNQADGYFEHYFTFGQQIHFTMVPDGAGATLGARTTFLDVLGRPTAHSVPAFESGFSSVRRTYDRLGRLATISRPVLGNDPPLNTSYSYDLRDRVLSVVAPDGVATRHEYVGLETHTYDGLNTHSYVVERPDGRIGARFEDDPKSDDWLQTSFDYGAFGLLRKTKSPDDTSQSMEYDKRGRRTKHVDPSAGTTTWTYNAFGELRLETAATGEERSVQIHDLLGRPWRISSPDGITTFNWDRPGALGKLDSSTQNDSNGHYVIMRFSYDDIGRNTRTSWEIDNESFFEVDTGFDDIGRLASITYPRLPAETELLAPPRLKVNYSYHPAGYLMAATDAASGAIYWQADRREADGQLAQETFGNGVVGMRDYQPETGLLETVTTDGPSGPLDQIVYGYDNNRNVTARHDLVGQNARTQTFHYDTLNRLNTWTHSRADEADLVSTVFNHDPLGNLLSESVTGRTGRDVVYQYGQNGAPPHALTRRNGQIYTYDAAGRRVADGTVNAITYNRRNLPLRIQRSSGGVTEFAYDAAGTRVLKRTGNSTRYSIGGLFERNLGNQVRNDHHIVAEGRAVAQVTLIQSEPDGPIADRITRYIHSDAQGSAILVTNDAGTSVAELFYDPFGRRTDGNYDPFAGMVPVRPGYTGHRHDDDFTFIDMKGRVYDINARRFLTPDPFIQAPLFSQSHNRYSYVWNNPATLVDPTGFWWERFVEWITGGGDGPGTGGTGSGSGWSDPFFEFSMGAAFGFLGRAENAFCVAWGCGGAGGGASFSHAPSSGDNYQTDSSSHGSGDGWEGGPGWDVPTDNWVASSGGGPEWDAWCGFPSCDETLTALPGYERAVAQVGFLRAMAETVDVAHQAAEKNTLEEMAENTWFGFGGMRVRGPIRLEPYREGGGHHVPAKSLFRRGRGWARGYDPRAALAISRRELDRQKIIHPIVTGTQHTLYGEIAKMGVRRIPWSAIEQIEITALVRGGASPKAARAAVVRVIEAMKKAGIEPTHIPWGF